MRMKVYPLLLLSILLIFTGCFFSTKPPNKLKSISFRFYREADTLNTKGIFMADMNKIQEALDIIKKRFDYYGVKVDIEEDPASGTYTLWIPEEANMEVARKLISTTGKIEIWETWLPATEDLPTSKDNVFHFLMRSPSQLPVFLIHQNDTTEARRTLIDYARDKGWPRNVKYLWSQQSADLRGNIFELYLIRSTASPQRPIITNTHIEKTASDERYSNWVIEIQLNTVGAERFQRATKENTGKALAIVIDGQVYSAPVVNSEISGGRLEITGNFTREQAEEFASMLRYKPLPLPVEIE